MILYNYSHDPRRRASTSFNAAFRSGENVLFPTFEGRVQDGHAIGQHGDPDLMAEFAEEYLRQFWKLMPSGRQPHSLTEIMPSVLLLVTATELALKAFWIRSDRTLKRSHSLLDLYSELAAEHRNEIERRYTEANAIAALVAIGIEPPQIDAVLGLYSETNSVDSVYLNSRYYAEPTTMLHPNSGLKGANLVKAGAPYPVFLPEVTRALIETYRYYSGAERLKRKGADLLWNVLDAGTDNHGEWGLVPSSLGLVVVAVTQHAGKDARYEDLRIFTEFKKSHPTGFIVDWMYGGNTLLFYHDKVQSFIDGESVTDGLAHKFWSEGRLGLHMRDLNKLADALEFSTNGEDRFGHFLNVGTLGNQPG